MRPDMTLGNGLSWAEMRNYWFFLIAKALVQKDGITMWDVRRDICLGQRDDRGGSEIRNSLER